MTEKITSKNAVIELLRSDPSRIEKIVIDKGLKGPKIEEMVNLCREKKIRYDFAPESGRGEAGGITAFVAEFRYARLDEIDLGAEDCAVVLDGIEDPHNLGAIARSAAAAGCGVLIIPERNSASVTDAAVSASAGNIFKLKVCRVKNVVQALEYLKEMGFWVTGTDMDGRPLYGGYDFTKKAAIVIGSEGKGLRHLVKEKCDDIVSIELENGVESLNASVAAALVLFERKRNS
ncbi:MAG: 23S rRNA (guanosine(2251)-2'-O)-methyltransferase RlmB [Candidatus Delongbacteria bacterium]|nr:23S rRNA (guanosine(2251)-2'-O)-methyltransferase RlmB [Candidatus Delongbacteria bacterium]